MRSLHRRSNLVSITVFSVAWGFCVLFFALPFTASAAGVTYQTTRVGPSSFVTNGYTSPITVNVAPAGGVARYQQIRPVASPSTLGKLARGAARGGVAGLAVTAAVEGIGYFIDNVSGQITAKDPVYSAPGGHVAGTGQTISGCVNPSTVPSYTYSVINPIAGSSCSNPASVRAEFAGWNCPAGTVSENAIELAFKCYPPGTDLSPTYQDRPATPSEVAAAELAIGNSLSLTNASQVINYVVSDASPRGNLDTSQYPHTLTSNNSQIQTLFNNWPALRIAYQNMLNAELAALIAASDPNFQPSPDEQVIVDNGSEGPPLTPVSGELPAFCEWASFLCEPFIATDHPDIPMLDLETENYDSGLPNNASCPAPVTVTLAVFGTHELSYQPICDFAALIRIPVIAISYLISAFIVVGVRR